ncbi:MAG TPA: AAA family ATPase [Candidatus Dormibacteraeota bacterium]
MRVLSVKIEGFGALTGSFEFNPGMTVVAGPNESGKSTLHTALRVALCGVDLPARGRMLKETEAVLRRFRPWRGNRFQVEVEVELDGGSYRFVRDLDRPDQAQVFDLVKGGDVTEKFRRGRTVDVSARLGMSRAAFLAVSTVAQDQILNLTGSSLQEDLQRASATSGGDSTARAAIERLEHWRQENIRGDRTTTKPLDRTQLPAKLTEAEAQLARALELHRQLAEDLGNQDALRAELGLVEIATRSREVEWKTAELAAIQQDLTAVAAIDKEIAAAPELRQPRDPIVLRDAATGARGLARQWQEAEAKVAEIAKVAPDLEQICRQSAQSELAFLATALEQPVPSLPQPAEDPARLELLDHRRIALTRLSADVVALGGGVVGVFMIVFAILHGGGLEVPMAAGGLALLVVVATAFFFLQRRLSLLLAVGGFASISEMRRAARAKDPELVKAMAERDKIEAERAQAEKRLAELGIAETSPDHVKDLAERLPAAQEALALTIAWRNTADRFSMELSARAKRLGITGQDPVQLAAELGARLQQLDQAEDAGRLRATLEARRSERLRGRDPKALAKRAEQLSQELVGLEATREGIPSKVPAEDLRRRYDESVRRRDDLRSQLLPLQGRLQAQLKDAAEVAVLEEKVAEIAEDVARRERAEEAVKLAISELRLAEGAIHNDLAPVLARGLEGWLPAITGQRYQHAWVDPANLAVHVSAEDGGAQISVDDLSQGTREQIYLALRTVLAQALSPRGEAVPLFFDDPTVSADDDRCGVLLDTLRELSAKTQVVVFTHESRVSSWADLAKVASLTLEVVPAGASRQAKELEALVGEEG